MLGKLLLNIVGPLSLIFFVLTAPARGTETESPQTRRIPLESFATLPHFENPQISPDGRHIAVMMLHGDELVLVLQKLIRHHDKEKEAPKILPGEEMFINWYKWANNDRLIVSRRTADRDLGGLWDISRLYSVSRHENEDTVLFKVKPGRRGGFRQYPRVVSWLEEEPDYVLAELDDEKDSWAMPVVHKVNVNTGKRELVLDNKMDVFRWIADSNGDIRIGIKYDTGNSTSNVTTFYRENENAGWEILQKADFFDHDRLEPMRFDTEDANILLLTSDNLEENDFSRASEEKLFRYDLTQRKVLGPYRDERSEKIIAAIKKAMPELDVEIVSHDKAKNLYILVVSSDIQAPTYFLYDIERKSLEMMASEYPDLVGARLAKMKKVGYSARDGLTIPALLTLPNDSGGKNLPVVVYPHGGPHAHDEWGFDNYVQFFANRGYAVFQPQYRGSTGLGVEHLEAGYGQWGMAIQDDISDGVKWLVQEGIADPKRICIVGASFGGYAAAIGAAKTPDLYCCAVSINGPLDLYMLRDKDGLAMFGNMRQPILNNPEKIKENSPYHLAENIDVPLLLIAGKRDTRVSARHSEKMFKALEKLNKPVTYVELSKGDHGHSSNPDEREMFGAIEDFLARHL